MEKIKCAVIGTGIFGEIHVHTYKTYDRAELVKICDINEKRAKEISKKYSVKYTTDYKEISEDKEIQAVSVATPDFAHKDIVCEMLKNEKNVLVEKPMATNLKDAEQMVKQSKLSKKILMTDFHNRFNPFFVNLKESFDKGEVGNISFIYARLSDRIDVPLKWFTWSGKSGPHWFLFPHIVDLVIWFSNSLPKRIYAIGKKGVLSSYEVDTYDSVTAILDFGKFYATLETSWIIPESWPSIVDFYFKLEGTKGRLIVDFNEFVNKISSDIKKQTFFPFIVGYTPVDDKPFGFASLPIQHFIDCIFENKKPIITPEDGLINVKIIEKIIESIEKGKIIEFK
ncbi:MAG: Gfo/Idh/MocA family oxidoreductase [Candidatus Omnitrophica bacterium]|nr:Gfo/Idh/MocA family oxidoreductase [Candidatus Omnitrophota bacterium]MCM8810403.1 Gfo/Idh/MocA family oxidoreductase [Candidatus Omnitrophota bacterium]